MIEEAIKIAKRSPQHRYLTGCVITKGDQIVSNGWSHKAEYKPEGLLSLHAELHALARGRNLNLRGGVAYVATVARKSGNITTAKPCLRCAIALRSAGIVGAYVTNKDGIDFIHIEDELQEFKVYDRWEN